MTIASLDDLIQTLRQRRLLEPDQLEELTRSPSALPAEPRALAGELIRRGWLTPYQVNQLFQGRDADLVLDSYVLLERLGEGGMGQVFKARHQKLGRIVALKIIRKERIATLSGVRRFHKEVQAAARLSHPNIVHAYDAGRDGDVHFFVMEYVEGIDLARLVRERGPLPAPLACDFIRQAALGLQHIHDNGLVHRDIKPANLLLTTASGGGHVVKLLDLGLARLHQTDGSDDASIDQTRQGVMVGTVDYVAPEQAMNSRDADIRADLYSLGCTFYYLLTGRVPFPDEEPLAKLVRHQSEYATPVERLRPDVPADVAVLIRQMMAKRPDDRPQTPAEVVRALAELAERGFRDRPKIAKRGGWSRRRVVLLTATCGIALAAVLTLLLMWWPNEEPPAPPAAIPPRTPKADKPAKDITNSLGMKLVRIPAGQFVMGSPASEPNRGQNEGPPRRVTIPRPFHLGAHLVTVGDFRAFVKAKDYKSEAEKGEGARWPRSEGELDPRCNWRNPGWEQSDRHPVACLSWNDCVAFCKWLSAKEQRTYRLPTETEWEYACRAGAATAYGFGDDPRRLSDYAWFAANSTGQAHPVGRLKPNAWGLYDMHGNLFQWCADWYDPHFYGQRPEAAGQEPPPRVTRVQRGGSWQSEAGDCRAARRIWDTPSDRRSDRGGFRVLLEPTGKER